MTAALSAAYECSDSLESTPRRTDPTDGSLSATDSVGEARYLTPILRRAIFPHSIPLAQFSQRHLGNLDPVSGNAVAN